MMPIDQEGNGLTSREIDREFFPICSQNMPKEPDILQVAQGAEILLSSVREAVDERAIP
jgi:hypothetical protein